MEIIEVLKKGIPFEVSLEDKSILKLVGVLIVATVCVVVIGKIAGKFN